MFRVQSLQKNCRTNKIKYHILWWSTRIVSLNWFLMIIESTNLQIYDKEANNSIISSLRLYHYIIK